MTTIDTSLAAIGIVKNYAHQSGWTVENTAPDSLARGVLNILAALAEREEQLCEVSQASAELHRRLAERDAELGRERNERCSLESQLAARQAEISAMKHLCSLSDSKTRSLMTENEVLQKSMYERGKELYSLREAFASEAKRVVDLEFKLAAQDACLANVREEMPEVELVRKHHEDRGYGFGVTADHIHWLLSAIDTLQQNEARWINARDVWEAERKRLIETIDLLEQQVDQRNADLRLLSDSRDKHSEFIERLKRQLSASNAACAEMREALRLAQSALRAPIDDWKGVLERKALDAVNPFLAAQSSANAEHSPKQREQK